LDRLTSLDAELYRHASHLFNQRLTEVRGKSPASLCSLPSAANFTFDQPILGAGWHPREMAGDVWHCWMEQEARLELAHPGAGNHLLRLTVAFLLHADSLPSLKVRVNGQIIPTRLRWDGVTHILEADVPAACLRRQSRRVTLEFRVTTACRPCDLDPTSTDRRTLGLALSRIEFEPHPGLVHTLGEKLQRSWRRWFPPEPVNRASA
jgi:hypothetical protein